MILNRVQRSVSWLAAYVACFTMTFSPLALAKESEKLTQQTLQQYIQEFGLDKKSTLGEFWDKTKTYYPKHVYKDFEKYVEENKNVLMPEVTVSSSKATDGTEVPVIRLTSQGKSSTLQIFGTKDKWATINSIVMSENDILNVDAIYKRLEASDINIKKEADKYRKAAEEKSKTSSNKTEDLKKLQAYKKDFARFDGFPRVTPQMWKSLTREERAGYIIHMRTMWQSALYTLDQFPKEEAKQPRSSIEEFYKNIFGQDAYAQSPKRKLAKAQPPYDAPNCIVAGYVGNYGTVINYNGEKKPVLGCSIEKALSSFSQSPDGKFIKEANEACARIAPSHVACNPMIYGYPEGKEICIDKKSIEFQQATTYGGFCDSKSPLNTAAALEDIKLGDKYKDLEPLEKRIALIEKDQSNQKDNLSKIFLEGVLKKRNSGLVSAFNKGVWSEELDSMLIDIQLQFESHITEAMRACENGIKTGKNEPNQKAACDQLHRRWLFTEREISRLRKNGCIAGSRYIGAYDDKEMVTGNNIETKEKTKLNKEKIGPKTPGLCECEKVKDSIDKPKRVKFGEKCEIKPLPPAETGNEKKCPAPMVNSPNEIGEMYCKCLYGTNDIVTLDEANRRILTVDKADDLCKGPGTPAKKECPNAPANTANYDSETCKCSDGYKLENDNEQNFVSKMFSKKDDAKASNMVCKKSTNWWPLAGILGLGVGLAIILHNKKVPKPPFPPPPSCAPKVGNPGQCICVKAGGCVVNQQIYDFSTCQCTDKPEPVKCPDGSLKPTVGTCPVCSDGSEKTVSMPGRLNGCPQVGEGGSGNNTCATPPCSAGVPAAK